MHFGRNMFCLELQSKAKIPPVSNLITLFLLLERKQPVAFAWGAANLNTLLLEEDKCKVGFVDILFPSGPLVFFMQRGFQYREMFDY